MSPEAHAIQRALASLQEALVELEAWRQNAREPAERFALRRMAGALGAAQRELLDLANGGSSYRDPQQAVLAL